MATSITSGVNRDPGAVAGAFSADVAALSDALVGLAAAAGALAIVITVVRGYLSAGDEKTGLALARVLRIALTVSLIAFFSWGAAQVAVSMGYRGV